MDAAQTIRDAVSRVTDLRDRANSNPGLRAATIAVKGLQARRFSGSYSDLLMSPEYGSAAQFFLEDLYSDKDYSSRDAQFARIAGGLQRLFPKQVVATAVSLAQLHMLTEELDQDMAVAWLATNSLGDQNEISRYINCWAKVDREADRRKQLGMVLEIGAELNRLTKIAGLRMLLRMMRKPANAAGLGSLQAFLETGFDTFAQMSGKGDRAREFLRIIQERELLWIGKLSSPDPASYTSELRACLPTTSHTNQTTN